MWERLTGGGDSWLLKGQRHLTASQPANPTATRHGRQVLGGELKEAVGWRGDVLLVSMSGKNCQ